MPHFEGLPLPLVPIHFWQKVRGLTPPLCSYIIRNVGSTPPIPEPVGVGDFILLKKYKKKVCIFNFICVELILLIGKLILLFMYNFM